MTSTLLYFKHAISVGESALASVAFIAIKYCGNSLWVNMEHRFILYGFLPGRAKRLALTASNDEIFAKTMEGRQ
ncbi:MAG: hypothetical protein IJF07_00915 [Lachnospiraceae bacterium]|nr:hypothetical protein [Lachnospiraceae bacterium]